MKLLKLKYLQYVTYVLVSLFISIYMLKEAKVILAPLVLATFLSIALLPVLKFINRFIKNNFWSVFALISFNSLIIGGIGLAIYLQFQDLEKDSQDLYQNIESGFQKIKDKLENTANLKTGDIEDLIEENQEKIIDSGSKTAILLVDNVSSFYFIPDYHSSLLFLFTVLQKADQLKT